MKSRKTGIDDLIHRAEIETYIENKHINAKEEGRVVR